MGRAIAIDFGMKRTGIAVTDPEQRIATPYDVIETPQLLTFIDHYLQNEPVDVIVIGEPRNLDGKDTHTSARVRQLYGTIRNKYKTIRVLLIDERFTSSLAFDTMIAGGVKKKGRRNKGMVDKISAALILQSYLESKGRLG